MDELKVLSGDNLTSDWIRKGEVANAYPGLFASSVSGQLLLSGKEVLENFLFETVPCGLLEQENLVLRNSNFVGTRIKSGYKLDLGSVLYNQAYCFQRSRIP